MTLWAFWQPTKSCVCWQWMVPNSMALHSDPPTSCTQQAVVSGNVCFFFLSHKCTNSRCFLVQLEVRPSGSGGELWTSHFKGTDSISSTNLCCKKEWISKFYVQAKTQHLDASVESRICVSCNSGSLLAMPLAAQACGLNKCHGSQLAKKIHRKGDCISATCKAGHKSSSKSLATL